ncbi:hypothetical protein SDC9_80482 [bioreactor metagenome]|uniref:Uncharacterized protein n=1 Tax=bioreactor metagenome TaxID=1076179 RepID=A0A644Z1L6_9ZZZZ
MENSQDALQICPLFKGISPEELDAMLRCLGAVTRTYQKDEYVFTAGTEAHSVGVILKGNVQAVKEDYAGNREILARLSSGELFGETFACTGISELPVSILSTEKSEILFIDYKRILTSCTSACAFHSRLIENMVRIIAEENLRLTQKIEHTMKRTIREKLLSYLSSQAIHAKSRTFVIPFNRQQLADYLSVDRSALSAELGRMREDGLLEFERSRFTLKGR